MSPSVAKSSEKSDYYTILGLPVPKRPGTAQLPLDTLKSAYRRTLLLHHPDKVAAQQASQKAALSPDRYFTVDQIAEAYETLSDPVSRSRYDEDLLKNKARLLARGRSKSGAGLETFDLEDLDYNDSSQKWSKKCRCGGSYSVSEQELEEVASEGEVVATCHGCSLCIRIIFDTVDEDSITSRQVMDSEHDLTPL
ncbi:hypothetical protein PMZ80_004600 [Knufia obscura]|uniref:Diphthamide biosynthesis protein 4 n=1 Tax=Knufia obscura TaxID=1635080 RepID=A0ABR0RSJ4_9EURO|nr:hypothetical protein PMZ80_004600 [Knufia obscura]